MTWTGQGQGHRPEVKGCRKHQTCPKILSKKHLSEVWKWLWHCLRSYVHKQSWPWPNFQGHRKVNIDLDQDFDPTNTSVKLENDCTSPWAVIVFTGKFDLDQIGKVTKVTERTRSNSSEILTPGTPLWSLKVIVIFHEELLCSQAKLTLTQFSRSQRS